METKLCRWCDPPQEKPISEFYKNHRAKDGLSSKCKECESKMHQVIYRTKKSHLRSSLKVNYKLTIKEFNKMYRNQKGACAICTVSGRRLVIDHDHISGKARGLLCDSCNHLLGRANDSIDILRNAIQYLEQSNA